MLKFNPLKEMKRDYAELFSARRYMEIDKRNHLRQLEIREGQSLGSKVSQLSKL